MGAVRQHGYANGAAPDANGASGPIRVVRPLSDDATRCRRRGLG